MCVFTTARLLFVLFCALKAGLVESATALDSSAAMVGVHIFARARLRFFCLLRERESVGMAFR